MYKGFSKIHYKRHWVEFYNSLVFDLKYNKSFKLKNFDFDRRYEPINLNGCLDPIEFVGLICGWSSQISGKYRKLFE